MPHSPTAQDWSIRGLFRRLALANAVAVALLAPVVPPVLSAQTPMPAGGQPVPLDAVRALALRDMKALADKFVALAEAFPEASYDWRPMEGVRSVAEVFALIAAENYGLFGRALGVQPPTEFADGKVARDRLLAVRDKSDIVRHLRASTALIRSTLELASLASIDSVPFFDGSRRPLHFALTAISADQHEHLGQLIAYARANRIVPPWSQPSAR